MPDLRVFICVCLKIYMLVYECFMTYKYRKIAGILLYLDDDEDMCVFPCNICL